MVSIQPDDPMTGNSIEIESDSTWDSNTSNTTPSLQDEWIYPHPTEFKLTEKPIDEVRELKVAVIGAGISGITAGILLPAKVPGIQLTIIDKNDDVVKSLMFLGCEGTMLSVRLGWYMVRKHLPRRPLRHPSPRLSIHLRSQHSMERRIRPRP